MKMGESMIKDDPLSRIQREIIEVTEREKEFREGHLRVNRLMSESTLEMNGTTKAMNGNVNGNPKALGRAVSTSQLLHPIAPSNGYVRKFTPQGGTKGIMQRFIASKGKLSITPVNTSPTAIIHAPISAQMSSPILISRTPEGRPIRKGFVPVEEKIQKELKEMKDRENELKVMRKKRRNYDNGSLELSDNETISDSEEEDDDDIPSPGKLKATKSIGELYEALKDSPRTPSPRQNGTNHDSLGGGMKPAKSLAELVDLSPGQEFLAPSSTRLIAQWESIIQQKQEAGAA